jgi:hypothetical protein
MNKQKENSATDQTKKNKKYVFVERQDTEYTSIKLTQEPYKGVIYHYGKVGFGKEENPDGTLPMIFDYTIDQNPYDKDLLDNEDFMSYIGDILVEVMEEQIENGTAIIK